MENTDAINEQFNRDLDLLQEGKTERQHIFNLGIPGEVLTNVGFPLRPIVLTKKQLVHKINEHGFSAMDIKNIVSEINDPLLVFSYKDDPAMAQNVILEKQINGKNILVGVRFYKNSIGEFITDIRTIFDKDTEKWTTWVGSNKLLYANIEKLQRFVDMQQTNSARSANKTLEPIFRLLEKHKNVKSFYAKKA
jgi:hypothetical protein